jgi:GNAT superfamily N-acetyltransferase
MDIKLRTATLNDLERLRSFEQELIKFERTFDDTLGQNIQYYDIERLIQDKESELVIAETTEEIIGCSYAKILKADSRYVYDKYTLIGFVYVVPNHRGKKLSATIIGKLQEWSNEQGVSEIRLRVYASNTSAAKAYREMGFRDNFIEMRLGS